MVEKRDIPKDPIGNDAMAATATGQALGQRLDLAHQANAQGKSTISEKDIALLKSRIEAQVKQMIASGAKDAEIQQAVAGLAGNPELAGIARDMAQQQLDAEKFNLFSTRNAGQDGQRFAFLDMGKTTEALATNTLTPANVKDLTFSTIVKSIIG